MKPTSYFIGIKIKSECLIDLYIAIQNILENSPNTLEFQNILSSHITLYYLNKELSENEISMIYKMIGDLDISEVTLDGFSYFPSEGEPKISYLSPFDEENKLGEINQRFRKEFHGHKNIKENRLTFIPHITLFKIIDSPVFQEKQELIETEINNFIKKSNTLNLFERVSIFKVNSEFHPEIQIEA